MEGKIIKNEVDPTGLLEIIARREIRSGKQEIDRYPAFLTTRMKRDG